MKFASKYLTLFLTVIALSLSVSLTSCGDDDEDLNTLLQGNWVFTEKINEDGVVYTNELKFNIRKDHTCTYTFTESAGGMTMSSSIECNWSVASANGADVLYINPIVEEEEMEDALAFYIYSITHSQMILNPAEEPSITMLFNRK